MNPVLLMERRDDVLWLTLHRPEVLNAVNLEMRDALWEAFCLAGEDPTLRCLVLRGAGERAFSAGADIGEFGTAPGFVRAREARRERDLWWRLITLPVPTVAAVQGWALGAGCEMASMCDVRIASDDARLGLPEVTLGYIPSAGGTQLVSRLLPPAEALAMVLSGEPLSAKRALELGLVDRVVPGAELEAETERMAARLAALPRPFVRALRPTLWDGAEGACEAALRREAARACTLLAGGH